MLYNQLRGEVRHKDFRGGVVIPSFYICHTAETDWSHTPDNTNNSQLASI